MLPNRVASELSISVGGSMVALTFHPDPFVAGVSICGMSDLGTLQQRGRTVRYLFFGDDGHEIVKSENHAAPLLTGWLRHLAGVRFRKLSAG